MITNLAYVAYCVVLYRCLALYFQVQYKSHFQVRTTERQERQPCAKAVTSNVDDILEQRQYHLQQLATYSIVHRYYSSIVTGPSRIRCLRERFLREEFKATKIEPLHSTQKREYARTENHSCLDCSVYFQYYFTNLKYG